MAPSATTAERETRSSPRVPARTAIAARPESAMAVRQTPRYPPGQAPK
jgi:hypothetical protein